MQIIGVVTMLVILTALGDYFLKIGSGQAQPYLAPATQAGAVLYLVSAYGWTYVMQKTNLTVVGAGYAALTIIVLTAMSLFVFKESVSARQLTGAGLALIAVCLLFETTES